MTNFIIINRKRISVGDTVKTKSDSSATVIELNGDKVKICVWRDNPHTDDMRQTFITVNRSDILEKV